MNPQPLEYVLGPEETLEIMEKGTDVSCKLVEVLINSGKGIIGMSAAVFGLASSRPRNIRICSTKQDCSQINITYRYERDYFD